MSLAKSSGCPILFHGFFVEGWEDREYIPSFPRSTTILTTPPMRRLSFVARVGKVQT